MLEGIGHSLHKIQFASYSSLNVLQIKKQNKTKKQHLITFSKYIRDCQVQGGYF